MEGSRAERMAAEIQKKFEELQASGQITPLKEAKLSVEKDTPELKKKRKAALAKLRTFVD